jgi:hypothetical protein
MFKFLRDQAKTYSQATVKQRFSALKALFTWATEAGYLEESLFSGVERTSVVEGAMRAAQSAEKSHSSEGGSWPLNTDMLPPFLSSDLSPQGSLGEQG